MASITHTQTRSVFENLYRVIDTVTVSEDIPPEVFVFRTEDEEYNRIATVSDMVELPSSRAQAVEDGADYYRLATITRDHETLGLAKNFCAVVNERIRLLVEEYDAALTSFLGSDTTTVSS